MGLFRRRTRGRASPTDGDPEEDLLARFPENVVAGEQHDAELLGAFPSIPPEHLTVLVAFVRVGAAETGHSLDDSKLRGVLEGFCRVYERGGLEVKRAGSEWQLWLRGEGITGG